MVETTVVRTIRVKGTSEGIDKLTGDLTKLAGAQENVAVVSEQTAKRTLSVEAAWKRQSMQLDENFRAQEQIARSTKVADNALQQGLITQQQHAERLQLISQRYTTAADATQKMTQQTGLARHELINLGRQAQDVGVSLLSGQSPFTVLAQQGTQIADVFISSGKSVGGFFTQAAGWARAFFTSTAGIVTGIGGIAAAAVYAASQFVTSQKTVQELLEEENRLLQAGKELIEAKTEAQKKYVAQLNQQTLYEAERNLVALQVKRNEAIEETIRLLERTRAVMTPSQVPGEMGEAPTGFSPSQVAGFKEVAEAAGRLRADLAAGNPDIRVFNEAISSIARRYAEVRPLADDILQSTRETANVTTKIAREEAAIAYLKGVATEDQKRVLGLQKVHDTQKKVTAQMQADARAMRDARDQTVSWSVANDEAGKIMRRNEAAAEDYAHAVNSIASSMFNAAQAALLANTAFVPFATTWKSLGPTSLGTGGMFQGKQGLSQFDPAGYTSQTTQTQQALFGAYAQYGEGGFTTNVVNGLTSIIPNAQGLEKRINDSLRAGQSINSQISSLIAGLGSQSAELQSASSQLLSRLTELLPEGEKAGVIQSQLGALRGQPETIARNEMIQQLTQTLEQLTQATRDNTNATQAMTDVLSPFYSSDPRRTYLGFRAFAGGGIMTDQGALPLNNNIATSRQVAVFGEGATPEAFVPVPSGRIPVEMRTPANSNERPIVVNVSMTSNVSRDEARRTGFQIAQEMKRRLA